MCKAFLRQGFSDFIQSTLSSYSASEHGNNGPLYLNGILRVSQYLEDKRLKD